MSSGSSSEDRKLSVFVNFPSPYTHSLILSALTSVLPSLSLTFDPPNESNVPDLQWADYDLLCLDTIQSNPSTQLISSYVYRKTLIRKHMLHAAIQEYLAKQRHRGTQANVLEKAIPRGWAIDIQFADELDELMVDELYDLREDLQENESAEEPSDRKWFVLKPGMSDKGQGIRMFSTEDELTAIFESFEPESDEEEEEDESEDEDEKITGSQDQEAINKMKELAMKDFPDDESDDAPEEDASDEEDGQLETGIFGVDLLLSFDPADTQAPLVITLLEFNASPDFTQSGNRLRDELAEAFKGVIKLVVAPFFDIKRFADEDDDAHRASSSLQIGEEESGWKKIGEQETRGTW
ncbi:hypothetical protein QFC22_003262 [Naganishia vaughanmartiniae]|uniref:Uncharacterized protein n=1 Tax=Naganishia vaughanmartiniae TaxID=1424756 RepID=A0ACC2X7F6_9TREE|nr:hypothetical protein QFC22_003262 [Naganishia vaughanmartiniae]